jgi:hypothetical protein
MTVNLESVGTVANVHWRAISQEHLRSHPLYRALPLPQELVISSMSTYSLYRQGTWVWDILHNGRLTTSRLACSLGFYEPLCAGHLDIPKSLQGHHRTVTAWQQLTSKPVGDVSLLVQSQIPSLIPPPEQLARWKACPSSDTKCFPFEYDISQSNTLSRSLSEAYYDASSARLAWGSAQEATAVLAVLNYFAMSEPGTVVHEAGMFLFENLAESAAHRHYLEQESVLRDILQGTTQKSVEVMARRSGDVYQSVFNSIYRDRTLPSLGASPDGILVHADGRIEVVEVKCVSPFVDITSSKSTTPATSNAQGSCMGVVGGFGRSRPGSTSKAAFGVWHVPQLMLEMFCVGAHCRSAVIAILIVTGARIFRLHRDDDVR